jgi:cytochrome c
MHRSVTAMTVLGLAFAAAACGQKRQDAEPAARTTTAPPAAFAPCRSCHTLEAGRTIIGPSLHGIVGKRAASVAGFTYSNALKASGLTWDAKTLDAWLAGPARLVPGSKMLFSGMPDRAKRREVIDYLAAQK